MAGPTLLRSFYPLQPAEAPRSVDRRCGNTEATLAGGLHSMTLDGARYYCWAAVGQEPQFPPVSQPAAEAPEAHAPPLAQAPPFAHVPPVAHAPPVGQVPSAALSQVPLAALGQATVAEAAAAAGALGAAVVPAVANHASDQRGDHEGSNLLHAHRIPPECARRTFARVCLRSVSATLVNME
jgi:hypothetical protein